MQKKIIIIILKIKVKKEEAKPAKSGIEPNQPIKLQLVNEE
jgi:hypothetical protein